VFGRPRWYQLFTHTLLHQDLIHLASNLLFLIVFGTRVNALIGQWKTAVLYPLLGALSGWAEAWATASHAPASGIGASGAVAGLAGMYLVLFPVHRVFCVAWVRGGLFTVMYKIFAVRGFWVVVFFVVWDALFLIATDEYNVAHWAHLGGFAAGFVAAVLLLVARGADARGADAISVVLGRRAWGLLGRPARRQPAPVTSR
jgi:membrane associated rhomboid family serine protease